MRGRHKPVVHHQNFKLLDIVNNELLEPIREVVAGLFVSPVANVWHQSTSLELSPYSGIDTLWPSPAFLSDKFKNK